MATGNDFTRPIGEELSPHGDLNRTMDQLAALKDHMKLLKPTGKTVAPPRLRLKLSTADDVRRELGRIYREGKAGTRDVGEVSRLANVLSILNRCIESGDLEQRIEQLEGNAK